jgi:hypothetical protein
MESCCATKRATRGAASWNKKNVKIAKGPARASGWVWGEKLSVVDSWENEAKRLVKQFNSIGIGNSMAKQFSGIAQQKYGGPSLEQLGCPAQLPRNACGRQRRRNGCCV